MTTVDSGSGFDTHRGSGLKTVRTTCRCMMVQKYGLVGNVREGAAPDNARKGSSTCIPSTGRNWRVFDTATD